MNNAYQMIDVAYLNITFCIFFLKMLGGYASPLKIQKYGMRGAEVILFSI